jgi:hypothetical protein
VVSGYALHDVPLCLEHKLAKATTTSVLAAACSNGTFLHAQRLGSHNTATFAHFVSSSELPQGSVLLLDNVTVPPLP